MSLNNCQISEHVVQTLRSLADSIEQFSCSPIEYCIGLETISKLHALKQDANTITSTTWDSITLAFFLQQFVLHTQEKS